MRESPLQLCDGVPASRVRLHGVSLWRRGLTFMGGAKTLLILIPYVLAIVALCMLLAGMSRRLDPITWACIAPFC